jgi:hypothetical protein
MTATAAAATAATAAYEYFPSRSLVSIDTASRSIIPGIAPLKTSITDVGTISRIDPSSTT